MAAVERGDPNPIWFDLPDGSRGRVWLAHEFWLGIADAGKSIAKNRTGRVKIGDERHWRVAGKVDRQRLARSPSTPSLADIWATELEQYSPQRELAGGSFRRRIGKSALRG